MSDVNSEEKVLSKKKNRVLHTWKDFFFRFVSSLDIIPESLGPLDRDITPIALICLLLQRHDKKTFFVVMEDIGRAEKCRDDFLTWCRVFNFHFQCITLPDGSIASQKILSADSVRANALFKILNESPDIVFGSISGVLANAPSPELSRRSVIDLQVGKRYAMRDLLAQFIELDYDDEEEVTISGEFAHHGGIIDVFSASEEFPARIEFFGDVIESIRLFNTENQMTLKHVSSYRIILRAGSAFELDEKDIVPAFQYLEKNDYRIALEYPDLLVHHLETYGMPDDRKIWECFVKKNADIIVALENTSGAAQNKSIPFLCFSTGKDALASSLPDEQKKAFINESAFSYFAQQLIVNRIQQWINEKIHVTLSFPENFKSDQVSKFLTEHKLETGPFLSLDFNNLPCGFFLPGERSAVLTFRELYSLPDKRRSSVGEELTEIMRQMDLSHNPEKEQNPILSAFDLCEGDYAVHVNYGICIYQGLKTVENNGVVEEVIQLEFDDGVILNVSVLHAHLITRYVGAKSGYVTLSKVGGTRWGIKKKEAAESIRTLAFDMLKIQAIREKNAGLAFPGDTPEQILFEESFPFYETKDQIQALKEIKRDMESDKPMDRLLCGDVGFGKTELAMRAAYKCALAGRQVAILVPTTVLAQQHFMTFSERFVGTSVTIEQLSRFKTKAEQAQIIQRLKSGAIDIIIGTHRLAQKDVGFKDLGLLIIDEEQRFGVEHKEYLKRMRATVDILTMTATPIPRTLHLSLSGIRDMSTLITAPVQRLPIRTVFAQYDYETIHKAIEFELNRGGQVYYLHNRVKTIEGEAAMLREMFPDTSIAVGHGKMNKDELEEVMRRFINGEIKILVCTTIIESGIDIPNANTILINRADTLGLAELYQLRGRVGRWVRQAYAFLFLPNSNLLSGNARKRIDAMRRYTHLGSGFQLAMSDLEIRGAGNILGSEQSGQINAIGFHLYCQLLNQTVQSFIGNKIRILKPCKLSFDFLTFAFSTNDSRITACIPREYVNSDKIRLHLYRRLGIICENNGDFDSLSREMEDRFGKLPDRFQNLLMVYRIKYAAQEYNIDKIDCMENVLRIERNSKLLRLQNNYLPVLPSILKPAQKLKVILQIVKNVNKELH